MRARSGQPWAAVPWGSMKLVGRWTLAVAVMITGVPRLSMSQTAGTGSGAKVQPPPAKTQPSDSALTAEDMRKVPNLRHSCPTNFRFRRILSPLNIIVELPVGRRIFSMADFVELRVPRFAHITRTSDTDYVRYSVRYGSSRDAQWLGLFTGAMVGGDRPDDIRNSSINWTSEAWGCHREAGGTDWRGVGPDGRRWRHITFPFGFATYEGVTPKAAAYFDKILDTMCCGKCPYWKN
jgi:hypothetical protein